MIFLPSAITFVMPLSTVTVIKPRLLQREASEVSGCAGLLADALKSMQLRECSDVGLDEFIFALKETELHRSYDAALQCHAHVHKTWTGA